MKFIYLIINVLRFGAEQITIKKSLLRSMIFLIVLTSGSVMLITTIGGYLAVKELSRSILIDTADRVEAELNRFFEPVTRTMRVMESWDRAGLINPDNRGGLYNLFSPILLNHPQISSVHAARGGTAEFMLLISPERAMARIIDYPVLGRNALFIEWADNRPAISRIEKTDYSLEARPWHKNALLSPGGLVWSDPYIFFTTKDPRLTVSLAWDHPRSRIVALDVELKELSRFTSSLEVMKSGMVFIFTAEGKVIGLPRHPDYTTPEGIRESVLMPLSGIAAKEPAEAVRVWSSEAAENSKGSEPFEFSSGGENWWAGIRQFSPGPGYTLNIGVAVPERDFLSNVKRQRVYIAAIAMLALIISVFMSVALARSYSGPIEELTEQSRRITRLDLTPGKPVESSIYEVDQLSKAQTNLRSAIGSFSKYVPVDVVRELMDRGEVAKIGGSARVLTVMFSDIKGFTTISEKLSPEALTAHMADYFELLLAILEDEGATVDKFIGDAILAFWGAPKPDPDHACRALRAVMGCRDALKAAAPEWESRGLPAMETRFGLDSGEVVVGNVGAPSRLSYTVLGDRVNQASRLEGLNKLYGTEILVSEEVRALTENCALWRVIDRVTVKGKAVPVTIHEPLAFPGGADAELIKTIRAYECAFTLYQKEKFSEAADLLRAYIDSDAASARLCRV
jgi:adenylate cyclase